MSPARRLFAVLFAAAQATLGAAFAVADGSLEAQATVEAAAVHVEAEGSSSCPRQHVADCAVCRALEGAARPAAACWSQREAIASSRAPNALVDPAGRAALRLPGSRGPPPATPGAARPRSG